MDAEKKYLDLVDEIIEKGPFKPTWESLSNVKLPEWFNQKRLGIFTHWGLYSVPAYAHEWYSRNMYIQGEHEYEHHLNTYGPHKDFGYKDFIPMFKAENFDAAEWISLFKKAGAGYYFPVAEHHDGFQMYKSELSNYNAAKMGPCRDVLGELKAEADKQGIEFCASSHRAEHWFFMSHGKEFDSDIKDPMQKGDFYWPAMPEPNTEDLRSDPYPTEEYMNDWLARCAELVLNYKPKMVYFDWWIHHEAWKPYLRKFAAFYYNCGAEWGEDVMICNKHDAFAFGCALPEMERGGFAAAQPFRWQTDTAVARNSWCHTTSLDYKSSEEIICNLVDVVSKNANMLLNVGPKADGSFADEDVKILEDLGAWMETNGEAINGSRPWRVAMEGAVNVAEGQFADGKALEYTSSDYRFTAGNGHIYATCLKCPEYGEYLVRSLAWHEAGDVLNYHLIINNAEILGYDGELKWEQTTEGLRVYAPGFKSDFPVVIKVSID